MPLFYPKNPMNPASRNKTVFKFVLFIGLAVLFLSLGKVFHLDEQRYRIFLTETPLWVSGTVFVILYVVVTSLVWLGPKDFFRMTSAIIYGAYVSTVLVYIGEIINAAIFFMLARRLGRDFVASKLHGRMKQVDDAVADAGFWWIFLMRIFIVPFRFLDLGCGLTPISFRKYFLIVLLASPVRLFLFQYMLTLGMDVIRDPLKLADHLSQNPFILWFTFAYLVGAVVMLAILRRRKSPAET